MVHTEKKDDAIQQLIHCPYYMVYRIDVEHRMETWQDKDHCVYHLENEKRLAGAAYFSVCAPWARSNGCKSRIRPDSGKYIAEQQGCPS